MENFGHTALEDGDANPSVPASRTSRLEDWTCTNIVIKTLLTSHSATGEFNFPPNNFALLSGVAARRSRL
eukprot:1192942-Prorocentrum_minimum.AAC.2